MSERVKLRVSQFCNEEHKLSLKSDSNHNKKTIKYGENYIPIRAKDGDYDLLINHPAINHEELVGDKSFEDLGLNFMTNEEIEALLS